MSEAGGKTMLGRSNEAPVGRIDGMPTAEAAIRATLQRNPGDAKAAVSLAELMQSQGRNQEALEIMAPLAAGDSPGHAVLVAYAEAQRATGRPEDAALTYRRALAAFPGPLAEHNLGAVLGDLAQFEEAEALSRRALAAGLSAPQTLLVHARALMGLGRLDESEAAFRQVLDRTPLDPDAWRELVQLIWMRTGDVGLALAPLDQALRTRGAHPRLLELRAVALKYCGEELNALQTIDFAAKRFSNDSAIRVFAAHMSIRANQPANAVAHAEAALASQPGFWTELSLAEILLGAGEAERASLVLDSLRRTAPADQTVLAYQALAWRLLGDARYGELYDYSRLVSVHQLDTPKGWSSLEAFLADLRPHLASQHRNFTAHPFQQSLVNGSQINNLLGSRDPVVAGLFEAVAGPIDRHIAALGEGQDPLRSRKTTGTRFEGVWSVRLKGGGGYHTGHVHQRGWISSAGYVTIPDLGAGSDDHAGWLKFGEPGIRTSPALGPEHFVKPQEGLIALFPSYMWHGTVPFDGDGERVSVAFDLLPG